MHDPSTSSEYGVNASQESIELHRWLHGMSLSHAHLRLSFFPSTGRGLQALSHLESNALLLRVPPTLVIRASTLPERSSSTHETLTVFLMKESALGRASKWFPYIQSLPKTYDVPFFIPDEEALNSLPAFWREPVMRQREELGGDPLRAWAFFTVNTRAVYHSDGGMALIPYLDMFNHSPSVSVSAREAPDGAYELRIGQSVSKYGQVFINYGPHGNIKLFLEYGFWVTPNPHDAIPVCLSDLLEVVGFPNEGGKALCRKQGLDQNMSLGITREGSVLPSWNVYACLDLLSGRRLEQVYRDNLQEDNMDLAASLLTNKLNELKASANALKNSFPFIRSCALASDLLFIYVRSLEAALSSYKE